jgi:hypothetical protein
VIGVDDVMTEINDVRPLRAGKSRKRQDRGIERFGVRAHPYRRQ